MKKGWTGASVKMKRIIFVSVFFITLVGLLWPPAGHRFTPNRISSLKILDRNGVLLRHVLSDAQGRGQWLELDKISPHVINLLVAAEDNRFFRHPGIDPIALGRATWQNIRAGRIVSGGSTLTQQLVRLVYDLNSKWYEKPIEFWLAIKLEIWFTKKEILQQYLNRAPFGNLTFGIEAAAQLYFNKPAAHLSLAEAAYLVGLPQAPSHLNPYRHPQNARKRQEMIVNLALHHHKLTPEQGKTILNTPLNLVSGQYQFKAPHFCQYVLSLYQRSDNTQPLPTTLDWYLQQTIEELVAGHVANLEADNVTNAACLVIDNHTGQIIAWVGSVDFFDEDHSGQVDGVLALRQPGSTLKPFTYGLALEKGYTAASILPDIETHAATAGGDYTVQNYDNSFHGPVSLRRALACSYNVPAIRLLEQLGTGHLLHKLHLAGMNNLVKPASYYGLGLTLGNGEVTLLELTRAYVALANYGKTIPITPFLQANSCQVNSDSSQVFTPEISYILTDILRDNQARAPAFGLSSPLALPFPCAVKTGTSKDFCDNWTVGYTTDYTVGVWAGNFDNTPMRRLSGVAGAAPIFRDVMVTLHRHHYPDQFTIPDGLSFCSVCSRSGKRANGFCQSLHQEIFITDTEPQDTCDVHQQFVLDTRNGMLAAARTPLQYIETRVFEILPPIYRTWAREHNLPVPPWRHSLLDQAVEETPDSVKSPDGLIISFPDHGDIFKIDPILRPEYQTLLLEAIVPDGIETINWLVNSEHYATCPSPFTVRWRLQKGEHEFQVSAGAIKSGKVKIKVF